MDFEAWISEVIKGMAYEFAQCQDKTKIEEVLREFNSAWINECARRIGLANDSERLRQKVNRLNQ